MTPPSSVLRKHARAIWQAAVDAARPRDLIRTAFADPGLPLLAEAARARRILVLGAGKAGAAMSAAVEQVLANQLDRVEGLVNVPASQVNMPVEEIAFPPDIPPGERLTAIAALSQTLKSLLPGLQFSSEMVNKGLAENDLSLLVLGWKAVEKNQAKIAERVQDILTYSRENEPGQEPSSLVRRIQLHPARPAGSNQPTAEGVAGARRILELAASAGPDDIGICLLSGGGSALLPAPVEGVSLEDKQKVTLLLHACGATINEMNAVRKHLSAIKGGRLAETFAGRALFSLIISDVIGDPLDVIASGPTAADSSTFADALAVLERHHLIARTPTAVLDHLRRGAAGQVPETPKTLPANVHNCVIGNNVKSLAAAQRRAEGLGYRVLNLGSCIEGETRQAATVLAGVLRSIRGQGVPLSPPVCVLSGGETTVTLASDHGLGGRNQEFVLAAAVKLGEDGLAGAVVLSGGTDGEDGPTDAAGALADDGTLRRAEALGLRALDFLARNDAYHFFATTGDLLKTGLTQTNVMDVRVFLIR